MRHKQLLLSVILLFGIGLSGLKAQITIDASGGNASGSGGSASYSVGQVVYRSQVGTNGSVTQGVQQPYEISVVTMIEVAKGFNLNLSAYPNPVIDNLTLTVENFELSTLNFQLYDINGRLLQNEKIVSTQTKIDMSYFISSTYFVKITNNNIEVKTFKIIKTK